MLKLGTTARFEKDYRKARKSGRDISRLKRVMTWIANEQQLPLELRDRGAMVVTEMPPTNT
jgi:mRNA-degrading endonuclease YafQ of YafQ-DinJ toxin-antitoxin module